MSATWTPIYTRWRHGGWYVSNLQYPNGASGCVSNNFEDKKWRIACDERDGDFTYPTRDAAARAEFEIVKSEHEALAPFLEGLTDSQLRFSAVDLFEKINKAPQADLASLVTSVLRIRSVDANLLREAGERYSNHLASTA